MNIFISRNDMSYYVKKIKTSRIKHWIEKSREIWFDELGFFTKRAIDNIKSVLDGKTFMDFEVISSNQAGNYSLGLVVNDSDRSDDDIKNFFLNVALSNLK